MSYDCFDAVSVHAHADVFIDHLNLRIKVYSLVIFIIEVFFIVLVGHFVPD